MMQVKKEKTLLNKIIKAFSQMEIKLKPMKLNLDHSNLTHVNALYTFLPHVRFALLPLLNLSFNKLEPFKIVIVLLRDLLVTSVLNYKLPVIHMESKMLNNKNLWKILLLIELKNKLDFIY